MRFDPSPATMGTIPQPVSLRILAAQLKGSEGRFSALRKGLTYQSAASEARVL